jgi:O-antigen/teichoic acid export membrane protein
LAAQLLIGAGPVVAQLFAGDADQAQIGAFLAALVVVRLPVLLFMAVQPSVLPTLSAHVAAGRGGAFRTLLVKVLAAMAALALLTTAATAGLGPWGLKLLFGSDYVLSHSVFALMGVSVGMYVIATGLSLVPLAYGRHPLIVLGWLTGLVGLAVGTALADDPVQRATMGLLVGATAATVVFALVAWRTMTTAPSAPPTGVEVTEPPLPVSTALTSNDIA